MRAHRTASNHVFIVLMALLGVGCGSSDAVHAEYGRRPAPTPIASADTIRPSTGRLSTEVHPTHYDLTLELDPREVEYTGTVQVELLLDRATSSVVLHGRSLEVTEAVLEQAEVPHAATVTTRASAGATIEDELVVTVPAPLEAGHATLRLSFRTAFDPGLRGIYRVQSNGRWFVGSKFEPTDARRGFPCFDEPGLRAPFQITVRAPSDLAIGTNAPEATRREADGFATVSFAETPALPTYLVAFAVGPYRIVDGPASSPIPLRAWVEEGREGGARFALEAAAAFLRSLEETTGERLPYPKLDLVAVPGYSSGATEHPGLVTFRDNLLLVSDDASLAELRTTASIVAHELAHLWFGDHLGIRWWSELWIKEGMASFYETRLVDAFRPELTVEDYEQSAIEDALIGDSLSTARPVLRPIVSSADAIDAYDPGVYARAAAVLGMIEHAMGEDAFARAVRRYVASERGRATDGDTLVAALDAETELDVAAIHRSFFTLADAPSLRTEIDCSASPRVTIRQVDSRGEPGAWTIPLCIATDVEPAERCLVLATPETSFELAACPHWVQPNAGAHSYARTVLTSAVTPMLGALASRPARERLALVHGLYDALERGDVDGRAIADALTMPAREPALVDALASLARRAQMVLPPAVIAPAVERAFARPLRVSGVAPRRGDSLVDQATRRARLVAAGAGRTPSRDVLTRTHTEARRRLRSHAADSSLRALLVVGMRSATADDVDALGRWLDVAHGAERPSLAAAIGVADDPDVRARGLALALTERVRPNELMTALYEALGVGDHGPSVLDWIAAHWTELAARLPARNRPQLLSLSHLACDPAAITRLEQSLASELAGVEGAAHALEQSRARAQRCADVRQRLAAPTATSRGTGSPAAARTGD